VRVTQIEQIPPGLLVPYAMNARQHSDAQVSQIAGSIRAFGFNAPVLVDGENGIIAGHGRVRAALILGLDTVPCVRLTHLSEAQRRAYILADNRIALSSTWDEAMLALELTSLKIDDVDLGLTGFSSAEVDALVNAGDFLPGSQDDQGQLNKLAEKMVCCPECGHEFDVNAGSNED
jgi:ParB-like chromosome segregation protein Spo0J